MTILKTSDEIKIYYQFVNKKSTKTPIVFVHGFSLNWTCFKNEINFFKKEGHPIIYFDLRGHGKSSKGIKLENYSFERFSKDILEILTANNIKRKVILVGYSLGGMISIKFTSTHQSKIKKLILIDTADKAPNQIPMIKQIQKNNIFRSTLTFLIQHHKKSTKKDENLTKKDEEGNAKIVFVEQLMNNDSKSMIEISDTIFSGEKFKVNQITCPTLIIESLKDEFFSKKEELELSRKLQKNIIKFFPAHHDIIMREPETISREIKQFIHTNKDFFE